MSSTLKQPLSTWATATLGNEAFYDRPQLAVWQASDGDAELQRLVESAGRALLKEDRLLQASFGTSPFYDTVGRGLSYWLFEHNLVYPIFREWAQTLDVIWDERDATWDAATARWHRPNASAEERRKRHRSQPRGFLDLQVLRDSGSRWLFEAKWWNSVRATGAVRDDVKKLRDHLRPRERGFVLAFWYGGRDSSQKDFDAVALEAIDAPAVFSVAFPSHVVNTWRGQAPSPEWGYFAMTVFEVLP
jgi:hypothetical protein